MAKATTTVFRMRDNTAVIVLGMHRSGTSALAGVLRLLGVELGSSSLAPAEDNVKGFWEHGEIVEIHERLLSSLGSSWDDVRPLPGSWWLDDRIMSTRAELIGVIQRDFAGAKVWGVKDPRMCRLVPLWLDVMNELGCRCCFVLVHRHPVEVARSLEKRNRLATERSGLLWVEHNLLAEKWTRNKARVFTSYDQLLGDLKGTTTRIAEMIGDDLAERVAQRMVGIEEFISPQLRHHTQPTREWGDEFGVHGPLVADTSKALVEACQGKATHMEVTFDKLRERHDAVTAAFDPALTGHIGDLQGRIRDLQQHLDGLFSSSSWRLTRPLREARQVANRIAGSRNSK